MTWFWHIYNRFREGHEWLTRNLERDSGMSAARAKALYGAGVLADPSASRLLHEEALALFRLLGDSKGAALSLLGLAYHFLAQNKPAAADSIARKSLVLR